MRVWRLCRRRHARDALGGKGGLEVSGRWHPRGRRIVYTSEHLSLAALEMLVHADRDLLPGDLVAVAIEVPDDLPRAELAPRDLPRDWRRSPAPPRLQLLGTDWLEREETALLSVPSAVIPDERNLLLNPAHPGARRMRVVARKPFAIDDRLFAARPRT